MKPSYKLDSERMYSTTVSADGLFDIDMFLLPLHLDHVGHQSKHWESRKSCQTGLLFCSSSFLQRPCS